MTTLRASNAIWIYCLGFIFLLSSCVEMKDSFDQLPTGKYRGVLFIDEEIRDMKEETFKTIHQIRDSELPFNFEIDYVDGEMVGHLINGEERIVIEEISFGQAKKGGRDTIRMEFPVYNSYITALFAERYLSGEWVDRNRGDYRIPFKAVHGQDHRFIQRSTESENSFGGSWAVTFDFDTESPYRAIGEFQQVGNELSGTFITETGDFRFLEGNAYKDQMFLSVFDGSHAFLFRAKISGDKQLTGIFKSGKHYTSNWRAVPLTEVDKDTFLRKPGELTYLKEGYESFEVEFPLPSGKMISLQDPQFEGKPKLVQILGTWCPNCRDETTFLQKYLDENPGKIEVLGLAFEKQVDQKAIQAIQTYHEKMQVKYPIALAGSYRKKLASEALPMLNQVISYPTLLFLNENNEVIHIHTGFNGPATSLYPEFVKEFEYWIDQLTDEK